MWGALEGISAAVLPAVTSARAEAMGLRGGEQGWLVSAENALRTGFYLPDPDVMWRARPNYSEYIAEPLIWGDERLTLNDWGHRNPPTTKAKPDGVRRVMVLGGSHPFGMWVKTGDSYAARLEQKLNARGEQRWEVLNAACPGHTSFQGMNYLEKFGLEFEPDIVFFDLGMNDGLPLSVGWSATDREVQAVGTFAKQASSLAGHSFVYRLLRRLLEPAAAPLTGDPDDWVRVPLSHRLDNVGRVQEMAREHQANVLFASQVYVIRPDLGWRGDPEMDKPGSASCAWDASQVEPRVEVCKIFEPFGTGARDYFVDDMHATPEGHALIADAVYGRLDDLGWLD